MAHTFGVCMEFLIVDAQKSVDCEEAVLKEKSEWENVYQGFLAGRERGGVGSPFLPRGGIDLSGQH